jgi:hypothetical protein
MLSQLADALPKKTIVDPSRGNHKQLRKKAPCKRKADNTQSVLSVSTSKRPRVTIEEIPDEEADGVQVSMSSSMSIESLVCKVSNIDYCFFLSIKFYSQQESETRYTISMSPSPLTPKDKAVALATNTSYHGSRKIIMVTGAMKYNLNGMQSLILLQLSLLKIH